MRRSPLTFPGLGAAVVALMLVACGNGTPPPDTGEDTAAEPPPEQTADADPEPEEETGSPNADTESPEPDTPEPESPEPDGEPDEDPTGEAQSEDETDHVDVAATDVVTGLEAPWDVAFMDERVFVTERDTGAVVELSDDGDTEQVRAFDVDTTAEAGLLGLVAGPEGLLYAYYTSHEDNRIVRFDPDDDGEPEVVFDQIPSAATHNGGRMVFGPDGQLYVGTGDAEDAAAAQDPEALAGKILRLTPEGDVPDDNPTEGSPVYSLGHRNVQGLTFDDQDTMYASEFGPEVDDEVNRIEPGGNYGWPEVTGDAGTEEFIDPVFVRQPDEGSWSGLAMLTDGAVPQWEGDLFLASLRGERMWRMELDDGEVVADDEFFVGEYGRLRQVEQAPDGSLWIITNNTDGRGSPSDGDDRIVRLGPGS